VSADSIWKYLKKLAARKHPVEAPEAPTAPERLLQIELRYDTHTTEAMSKVSRFAVSSAPRRRVMCNGV
jgi:hypothetical protein